MSGSSPGKRGGLNGSSQHWLEVYLQESTKLNSLNGVDSNGTPPFLGSDWVQPYISVP
jgi:hypothetical protein